MRHPLKLPDSACVGVWKQLGSDGVTITVIVGVEREATASHG